MLFCKDLYFGGAQISRSFYLYTVCVCLCDVVHSYFGIVVVFTSMYVFVTFQNPIGVTVGGTLGHALCTALAVIGGKIVAQRLSVKTGWL